MRNKIVRLTREVEGQIESRIYVKTDRGYVPLTIQTEQTEDFPYTKSEELGEIELPTMSSTKLNIHSGR